MWPITTPRRRWPVPSPAERAIFYKPEQAFARGVARLAPHAFIAERDKAYSAEQSMWIDIDLADKLEVPWPCTTPAMLARYGVVKQGGNLTSSMASSGSALYVLRGAGTTSVAGEAVAWEAGDALCVPGFEHVEHRAEADSILFEVSDAPLLNLVGANSCDSRIGFAHFEHGKIHEGLEEVHARTGEQKAAGKSVVFVTPACAALRLLTPTLLASVNSLEPCGEQRPHRHNSAALTLAVGGHRVFSMVDGERVNWVEGAAMLTPAGAVHSHHNPGTERMLSFVVQDTGLHTYLQTTGFEFTAEYRGSDSANAGAGAVEKKEH